MVYDFLTEDKEKISVLNVKGNYDGVKVGDNIDISLTIGTIKTPIQLVAECVAIREAPVGDGYGLEYYDISLRKDSTG